MSKQARRFLEFWVRWTLLNGVAWCIGLGLVEVLIGKPGGLWAWGSGLVSGLVIGTIQGLGVNRRDWTSWLVVSTLGWLPSLGIASTVSYSLYVRLVPLSAASDSVRALTYYVLLGVLGGVSSASLQYLVHWRYVSQSKTWLPVLGISAMIAGLASGLAMSGIQILVSLFALYSLRNMWHLLGTGLGGTLFGAISGLPLGRLHTLAD
jgi:hypothetical protein